MKNLLLIGGGGHCLTVIDSLNSSDYNKIGIIDTRDKAGQEIFGIPVVGDDNDLSGLRNEYDNAFISLGGIGIWEKRKEISDKLRDLKFRIPIIVHSTAVISTHAEINDGTLVAQSALINAGTQINQMCIINTGSIVEHQCNIDSFVHIAPGAVLCANVKIGEGSHIGAGSVIKQGITIGRNTLIGIGSVVTSNIPDNVVAYGNPCRVVEKQEEIYG